MLLRLTLLHPLHPCKPLLYFAFSQPTRSAHIKAGARALSVDRLSVCSEHIEEFCVEIEKTMQVSRQTSIVYI